MSGHSKWSNIHRKKEANDKVRSGIFTKLASAIVVAVKKGGGIGDVEKYCVLRVAVDKAR
ncbi:MAG: YebC/PmpR family DNA-binding transcriptional regulator, partial [Candidatus Moraniibacteriota bacterium]